MPRPIRGPMKFVRRDMYLNEVVGEEYNALARITDSLCSIPFRGAFVLMYEGKSGRVFTKIASRAHGGVVEYQRRSGDWEFGLYSSGYDHGNKCHIVVNGHDFLEGRTREDGKPLRGLACAWFNQTKEARVEVFDTHRDINAGLAMSRFLRHVPSTAVIVVVAVDEATMCLGRAGLKVLRDLGADLPFDDGDHLKHLLKNRRCDIRFLQNLFHFAVKLNAIKCVAALLDFGVKVNDSRGKFNNSALIEAAWRGNEEMVSFLIARGADVSFVNNQGESLATMNFYPLPK